MRSFNYQALCLVGVFSISACKPQKNMEEVATEAASAGRNGDFLLAECVNGAKTETVSAYVRKSSKGSALELFVEKNGKSLGTAMEFNEGTSSYVGSYNYLTYSEKTHCAGFILQSVEGANLRFEISELRKKVYNDRRGPKFVPGSTDEEREAAQKSWENQRKTLESKLVNLENAFKKLQMGKLHKLEIGVALPPSGGQQCTHKYLNPEIGGNEDVIFGPNLGYKCQLKWGNLKTYIHPLIKEIL
jgi:hypothetical protein